MTRAFSSRHVIGNPLRFVGLREWITPSWTECRNRLCWLWWSATGGLWYPSAGPWGTASMSMRVVAYFAGMVMPSTRTIEETREAASSHSVSPTYLQVISHGGAWQAG